MRVVDDFDAIRARLEELRQERAPERSDKGEPDRSRERIIVSVKPTIVFRGRRTT